MSQHLQRGNLLWESSRMFLPEHKEALLDRKQQLKKVKKPQLDEQELEEIGIIVMDSLKHELNVHVTYWEDGILHNLVGTVDKFDWSSKKLKLKMSEEIRTIAIDCLKSVARQ
ncbi:YolD-like family protein [Halalkalibacter kiskunsagensis]|uniref:YolD-like family protein n=1 Tax=Halalkalibacter kiskunsagensis TaxID=1548599 RepID=A0ABV6KA27_9BACI